MPGELKGDVLDRSGRLLLGFGAQQSATAAAQLNGNAEELQRLVRQFKI